MSYRTTPTEVTKVMGEVSFDLEPFIHTANVMIDHMISSLLSETILTEIEKYLAAHFACLREPQIFSETIDDAKVSYMRKVAGPGLESTDYGQTVLQLDSTGILANSMKPAAGIYAPDVLTEDRSP